MDMIARDQLPGNLLAIDINGSDTEAACDVQTPRGTVDRGECEPRIAFLTGDRLENSESGLRAGGILRNRKFGSGNRCAGHSI